MLDLNFETKEQMIKKYINKIRELNTEYKYMTDEDILLEGIKQLHADELFNYMLFNE